jgi:hypothetical protein
MRIQISFFFRNLIVFLIEFCFFKFAWRFAIECIPSIRRHLFFFQLVACLHSKKTYGGRQWIDDLECDHWHLKRSDEQTDIYTHIQREQGPLHFVRTHFLTLNVTKSWYDFQIVHQTPPFELIFKVKVILKKNKNG